MRYQLGLLALGIFLAITSCEGNFQQSPQKTLQGKYTLGKIVGREYRYTDSAQCRREAQAYFKGNYPGSTTEILTKVTTFPLVYSMKAKGEDVEVRFVQVSQNDLTKYGDFIYYYKIDKTPGHPGYTEQQDVDAAAKEFKVLSDDILRDAFRDERPLEGKQPWRALLKRKKPKSSHPVVGDEEEYGVIINPPYPR
ncbi:MAG: hypothetical protein JWR44_815 [Hymenobacter sp.]|jgi:hypothetical protein|nr:hypothetical protein [Hymenobacter sp.]